MNTAVINIRTDARVKSEAQKIAEKLGFSLSSLINGFLKSLIKTKTVHFAVKEEPSEYLIKALKEAEEDIKTGRVSPTFDNADDGIAWLHSKRKRYASKIQ